MNPVKPKPIVLGGGHCCMCSVVCGHIGGPYYCASHQPAAGEVTPAPITCG